MLSKESLRILYQGTNNVAQEIAKKERALVEQFAKENQLTIEWHAIEEEWQLMSALINGHGDIVIGQGESLASGLTAHARDSSFEKSNATLTSGCCGRYSPR